MSCKVLLLPVHQVFPLGRTVLLHPSNGQAYLLIFRLVIKLASPVDPTIEADFLLLGDLFFLTSPLPNPRNFQRVSRLHILAEIRDPLFD